jgi:hypothetical protein
MRRSAIQGDQSSPRKRNTAACVTALHAGQLQANYAVQIQAYCVTAVALDRKRRASVRGDSLLECGFTSPHMW